MVVRVGVFSGGTRMGTVEFSTLLVTKPDDYRCEPADLLGHEDVVKISWGLRRLPALNLRGSVAGLSWREEAASQGLQAVARRRFTSH